MTTLNTIIEEEKKEFIEKGADIEHKRWSNWQKWCHKVLRENCPSPELEKVLERWDKQIATPYSELSEAEKESDRREVRSYDELLTSAMQRAYEAGANNERASWLRSEIEKLEGMKVQEKGKITMTFRGGSTYEVEADSDRATFYNRALTSVITRYKEELLEFDKTNGL